MSQQAYFNKLTRDMRKDWRAVSDRLILNPDLNYIDVDILDRIFKSRINIKNRLDLTSNRSIETINSIPTFIRVFDHQLSKTVNYLVDLDLAMAAKPSGPPFNLPA